MVERKEKNTHLITKLNKMLAGAIRPRPTLQQSPYREQKQNELQQGSPWIILVRTLHISLDDS